MTRGGNLLAREEGNHEGCPYGRPTAPAPLDPGFRREDEGVLEVGAAA